MLLCSGSTVVMLYCDDTSTITTSIVAIDYC